jgi:electron transfer flavoprotein beta subunit
MKILVAVKTVEMVEDEIEFTDDGREIDPDFLEREINDWDRYANEEAVRLRDSLGGEVVVVSVGDDESDEVLRRCLALGADRAIRVDARLTDPLSVARALATVVQAEQPDLVLCGVQSSDSVQGATGAALAGVLDWPVATVVRRLDWNASGAAIVESELNGGAIQTIEVDTPAVMTVQTGINEPRFGTLRAIKQMADRPIELVEFVAEDAEGYVVSELRVPERAAGGTLLEGGPREIAARILEIVNGEPT